MGHPHDLVGTAESGSGNLPEEQEVGKQTGPRLK